MNMCFRLLSPGLASFWLLSLSAFASSEAVSASDLAEPLPIFNQNPLILIYGLPAARGPGVLGAGEQRLQFDLDFSSHFVARSEPGERILLDGETTRAAITWRRGLATGPARGTEISVSVPFVDHSAGIADSFIDEFHDFTGFSDGGRSNGPQQRQQYAYRRNGRLLLNVDDSPSGLGDIRLGLAKSLLDAGASQASINAQLELPTGDADKLTGSESVDFSLWTSAGRGNFLIPGFSVVGALGGLLTGEGEVLEDQRQQAAGFGWLNLGYAWSESLVFKAMTYVHTPLYRDSDLNAVEAVAVQGGAGFAWRFSGGTRLDLSIIEDLHQDASPDVSFNLALGTRF